MSMKMDRCAESIRSFRGYFGGTHEYACTDRSMRVSPIYSFMWPGLLPTKHNKTTVIYPKTLQAIQRLLKKYSSVYNIE